MKDIFNVRFKEILENEQINQSKMAKEIGICKQCISDFKSGKSVPSIYTLRLICKYLDVSSDYLLGIQDEL